MKLVSAACLALFLAAVLSASPLSITISDPGGYGGTMPGNAASNGDVIGLLKYFDVDAIRFTTIEAMKVEAVIRMNYNNGDATLSPFSIGGGFPTLRPGDLLFEVDGIYTYGVPLSRHDMLTAGALYHVTNAQPFTKDAKTVLNYGSSSSTNFNPNVPVWINAYNAVEAGANLSFIPVQVGATSAVDITVSFVPDLQFLAYLERGVGVHFASATCANDYIDGRLQHVVPEPVPLVLTGFGLLSIGVFGQRLRRRS
jgi:hypothetical protein